jgi:hypothetical protein
MMQAHPLALRTFTIIIEPVAIQSRVIEASCQCRPRLVN